MLRSVLNMICACTAAAQVMCGSSVAGRRKGAFHSGRTLFGTLVDAIQGSDLPAPSWPFPLPLPIFPLTSKGNEVVRQGRAEDPVLISKDRRQSIEYHCSPSQCTCTLLSIAASCTRRANLATGELEGPTQATNKSTQLDGVQTPRRSMTSPWRKGHQGFV